MAKYTPDEITYELFGINPAKFYKTKFACGRGLDNALANPIHRYEITYEKIRLLIADVKTLGAPGAKILDIGCGAGPYGPTVLANAPGVVLYGVDMSRRCLSQAKKNGYTKCWKVDLTAPLPFEDGFFDGVISMDTFGHIEFRHKDFVISEIARITRPGGWGHHGVETGFVDYFNCDPLNEEDPVRKYVYVDGHVGAEPSRAVCDRFSKHFSSVLPRITYLYPFMHKDAIGTLFEAEFAALLDQYKSPEAVTLANIILGRLNRYFLDTFAVHFGAALKAHDEFDQISDAHPGARERVQAIIDDHNHNNGIDFIPVPRELFRATGFGSITMTGRMPL